MLGLDERMDIGANLFAGYQYQGYARNGIYERNPAKDFLYGAGAHTGIEYRFSALLFFLEGAWLFEFDHSWIVNAGIKYCF